MLFRSNFKLDISSMNISICFVALNQFVDLLTDLLMNLLQLLCELFCCWSWNCWKRMSWMTRMTTSLKLSSLIQFLYLFSSTSSVRSDEKKLKGAARQSDEQLTWVDGILTEWQAQQIEGTCRDVSYNASLYILSVQTPKLLNFIQWSWEIQGAVPDKKEKVPYLPHSSSEGRRLAQRETAVRTNEGELSWMGLLESP